jgi:mono/diheme cytochrome c family protein
VPAGSSAAIDGQQLYREYCAVCHGTEARGGGPAAAALKKAAADLTQIARKNAGKFPEARVRFVIDGEGAVIPAHGSREMPIWGRIFRHTGSDRDLGAVKVFNLVKYIESLQAK